MTVSRRSYGLWIKRKGQRNWELLYPQNIYSLESARKVFQTQLINNALGSGPFDGELRLRPVETLATLARKPSRD